MDPNKLKAIKIFVIVNAIILIGGIGVLVFAISSCISALSGRDSYNQCTKEVIKLEGYGDIENIQHLDESNQIMFTFYDKEKLVQKVMVLDYCSNHVISTIEITE